MDKMRSRDTASPGRWCDSADVNKSRGVTNLCPRHIPDTRHSQINKQNAPMSTHDANQPSVPDFSQEVRAKSVMAALREAVHRGDLPLVERLLPVMRTAVLPFTRHWGGNSFDNVIIADAIDLGRCDVIEKVVQGGGNVDGIVRGKRHLERAILGQKEQAVKTLVALGADVNAGAEVAGKTALHRAAAHGTAGVVFCLLAHGADPEARDKVHGNTPLHDACAYCNREAALALFERGAEFNAVNQMGKTPLAKLLEPVTRADDFSNRRRLNLARELVPRGFLVLADTQTREVAVPAGRRAKSGMAGRERGARRVKVTPTSPVPTTTPATCGQPDDGTSGQGQSSRVLRSKRMVKGSGSEVMIDPEVSSREAASISNLLSRKSETHRDKRAQRKEISAPSAGTGSDLSTDVSSRREETQVSGRSRSPSRDVVAVVSFPTKGSKLYQLYRQVVREVSETLTLQQHCRLAIISSVQGPLAPAVKQLPLPGLLQRYLRAGDHHPLVLAVREGNV